MAWKLLKKARDNNNASIAGGAEHCKTPSGETRVVIIGGGFGGVFVARQLRRRCPPGTRIELIDEKNYFVFQPLLPEVLSGTLNAQDAVTPQRALLGKGVRFRQAEVKRIDFDKRTISLVQGERRLLVEKPWDHLVLANGTAPATGMVPGLGEHAFPLKDLADAFVLRNHVLQCLEWADVTDRPDYKRRALCFVIAGGGFSGVETAGELEDMLRRAKRYYPQIERNRMRVVLMHRGDRLLPELPPRLSAYAERELARRGVEIMLNTTLAQVTATYAETADGMILPTLTLISTLGNVPTQLAAGLPQIDKGKLPTDRMLRVRGHENVWALGDAARIPLDDDGEKFAPPTGQFAVQEAHALARNLAATLRGREPRPFAYAPKGMLASLGGYRGVAEIFGVPLRGVLAWAAWRGIYMAKLPGVVTRLRVVLNWLLDYFVPRTIVEMEQKPRPAVRFACYREGDILFHPGELLNGLHVVLEGRLEVRVRSPGEEDFVKIVGPQEHFGDRIRSFDTHAIGEIRALENTRVAIFGWRDMVRLRDAFDFFDSYLQQSSRGKYPEHIYKQSGICKPPGDGGA